MVNPDKLEGLLITFIAIIGISANVLTLFVLNRKTSLKSLKLRPTLANLLTAQAVFDVIFLGTICVLNGFRKINHDVEMFIFK